MRSARAVLQRLGGADKQRFELLNLDVNPMQMSRQPGIRQQFVGRLEPSVPEFIILFPKLFDFLARFCVRFLPDFRLSK
jgi:hypothetical protein